MTTSDAAAARHQAERAVYAARTQAEHDIATGWHDLAVRVEREAKGPQRPRIGDPIVRRRQAR